jgi:dihydroorotase
VKTALLMRRALEYAACSDMPVLEHCEDPSLKGEGVAHEGTTRRRSAARHSGVAESIMVQRDIALAEMTGAPCTSAHERGDVAARGARGEAAWRARDVRGRAAPLHADRRVVCRRR